MLRCDLCGPYTALEAAAIVLGKWRPERTCYLCPDCQQAVSANAQQLADAIDKGIMETIMKEHYA